MSRQKKVNKSAALARLHKQIKRLEEARARPAKRVATRNPLRLITVRTVEDLVLVSLYLEVHGAALVDISEVTTAIKEKYHEMVDRLKTLKFVSVFQEFVTKGEGVESVKGDGKRKMSVLAYGEKANPDDAPFQAVGDLVSAWVRRIPLLKQLGKKTLYICSSCGSWHKDLLPLRDSR
jgi:hypothetical protein